MSSFATEVNWWPASLRLYQHSKRWSPSVDAPQATSAKCHHNPKSTLQTTFCRPPVKQRVGRQPGSKPHSVGRLCLCWSHSCQPSQPPFRSSRRHPPKGPRLQRLALSASWLGDFPQATPPPLYNGDDCPLRPSRLRPTLTTLTTFTTTSILLHHYFSTFTVLNTFTAACVTQCDGLAQLRR